MKKIIDIDERFLEEARAALAEKMPWEKNITAKQTVNAALSFYAACARFGVVNAAAKMKKG